MCPRSDNKGGVDSDLTMSELTLEDCKKIFPVDFVHQLTHMYMCGNFGDPAIAKDTLEVFRYFRENNPKMTMTMFTNGGLRNKEWWIELAHVLGDKGIVVFSVDGLRDTNHIYRQNVVWDKVEANMRTFISSGGRARWDYLIFAHNQHQVEEARKFSEELEFIEFRSKKSARFSQDITKIQEEINVVDRKNNPVIIQKPAKEFQNKEISRAESIIEKYGSAKNYLDKAVISCKVIPLQSIYISAEGLLLPCCWVGGELYWNKHKDNQVRSLIDKLGKEKLNARNGLQSVFDSGVFDIIKDGWGNTCKNGKLQICAKTCAVEYDPMGAQLL